MAAVDFNSVGDRASSKKLQPVPNTVPIGIKTPLRFGVGSDGLFAMNFNIADQVQDNLRNLLLTNHGERLGLFDFGADLNELSMERGQDEFDAEAITRIRTAINAYMPFVIPRTLESQQVAGASGIVGLVNITMTYDVPRLGIMGRVIQVSIYTRG